MLGLNVRGGDVITHAFINEGVEYFFTVAAEQILRVIIGSELAGKPRPINAAFEPGAGFMSVVYSRVTGRVGVSVFAAGPGILSAINPIAMAHVESDPLVVIASTPPRDVAYRNSLHALFTDSDQLSVLRTLTKKQFKVTHANQLPYVISKAFNIAQSDRPGPVYVEVPADILDEEVSEFTYVRLPPSKPTPPEYLVDEVLKLLRSAERPVILAGRGVTLSGAEGEVISLAELLDAPVCTTVMGKGIIPPSHPLYAGIAAGRLGNSVAEEVLANADVVLAVGVRFSEMGTGRYSMRINGKLIHVNVCADEIGRVFKPDVAVVADAKEFLVKLLSRIRGEGLTFRRGSSEYLRNLWMREGGGNLDISKGDLIEPWELVNAMRKVFDEDTIIVGDVGAHRIETFTMHVYKPRRYIISTSYVSMGMGVPGAIAAKLAKMDSKVIGIVGDGGFLMTGLEIATGVRYGIPAVVIVFNDSSYRVLRVYEKVRYGTEFTYKLPNVNFSELAKALGAHGVRVERRDELEDGLNRALSLARDRPVVVDVVINPEAVPGPMVRLYGARYVSELGK